MPLVSAHSFIIVWNKSVHKVPHPDVAIILGGSSASGFDRTLQHCSKGKGCLIKIFFFPPSFWHKKPRNIFTAGSSLEITRQTLAPSRGTAKKLLLCCIKSLATLKTRIKFNIPFMQCSLSLNETPFFHWTRKLQFKHAAWERSENILKICKNWAQMLYKLMTNYNWETC